MGKWVLIGLCILLVGCTAPAPVIASSPLPTSTAVVPPANIAAPASGKLTLVEFFAVT